MDALNTLGITSMGFISQLVNFVVIMLVLTTLLYNPIRRTLIARRERIAAGIKQSEMAEVAAAEAEQTKQKILEEARDEAQQIRATATRDRFAREPKRRLPRFASALIRKRKPRRKPSWEMPVGKLQNWPCWVLNAFWSVNCRTQWTRSNSSRH